MVLGSRVVLRSRGLNQEGLGDARHLPSGPYARVHFLERREVVTLLDIAILVLGALNLHLYVQDPRWIRVFNLVSGVVCIGCAIL